MAFLKLKSMISQEYPFNFYLCNVSHSSTHQSMIEYSFHHTVKVLPPCSSGLGFILICEKIVHYFCIDRREVITIPFNFHKLDIFPTIPSTLLHPLEMSLPWFPFMSSVILQFIRPSSLWIMKVIKFVLKK